MVHSLKPLSVVRSREEDLIGDEMTVACNAYQGSLIRRAQYKTNNREVSQDLVQTTFLKTMQYLIRGGKINLMRSFLNHILNALIVDEYRKKKATSLDILIENGFEPAEDDSKRMENISDGKSLVFLIPKLPKKYALVIQMRYLRGLSLKEISALTGQSENTVAVQLHRGLVKLRKLYVGTLKLPVSK